MTNQRSLTQPQVVVIAVLFADVVDWTGKCSRLGDTVAKGLVDALFARLSQIVAEHAGRVVKRIGDELMCVFDSAEAAARAACAMQRCAEAQIDRSPEPVLLRIGFHAGPVICDGDDLFGDTVNLAARVVAASSAERVLATRAAADELPPDFSARLRPWRTEPIKGQESAIELVELMWHEGGALDRTVLAGIDGLLAPSSRRLILHCQGQSLVLEESGKPLSFGRSSANELVIEDPSMRVSGSHGRIEWRGGALVLVDTSTNGIHVEFGDEPFFPVQKTLILRKSGRMSIGRPLNDPTAIIAYFDVE